MPGRVTWDDLASGARLLSRLPARLRTPVTREEARAALRQRLDHRTDDFLDAVQRTIYEQPRSPYRWLLARAGCEWGDLARMVRGDGVEAALGSLLRAGVYLTVDEFKGRRGIVRGRDACDTGPHRFDNPLVAPDMTSGTSGSRGVPTAVPLSLAQIRENAVDLLLCLDARGGLGWTHALWVTPGSAALSSSLRLAMAGAPPRRWFSQIDPRTARLPARYAWSARIVRWAGALAGCTIAAPEHVPAQDPEPIARWMTEALARGETPHLDTYVSGAVAVARAADRSGLSLGGAQFTVTGEPVTPRRVAVIEATGASVVSRYALVETGPISHSCLARETSDEVHVFDHRYALVQAGAEDRGSGLPERAVLLTSISASARMILLNVSMGDEGDLGRRDCGCPLERLGWRTHLQRLRSFEKLTAAGMTFADADIIGVLERILPGAFGGGPGDYQLQEMEDETGRPRLRLVVAPSIGPVDPVAVSHAFLHAVGARGGPDRVVQEAWQAWQVVEVARELPAATRSGKILHFHAIRRG